MLTNKEEPPYDKNGKVIPLAGMMSSTTAMLMSAWKPNSADNATARYVPNRSGAVRAATSPRHTNKQNRAITA